MTPDDVSRVLAAAAARDFRTVGVSDVLAWHEDIGDLDAADALAAVSRHYRETTERLMPAHVRRIVAELERDRRRVLREQREADELRVLEADPTRGERSEAVRALIAELRDRLPDGDPDKLRRAEWVEVDKRREREAEPNPDFVAFPPPGGHPLPEEAPSGTVDLMAALRASLERAKTARIAESEPQP